MQGRRVLEAKDAETRVGSKTAWMGAPDWDEKGKRREVVGWEIELPDGVMAPQVRAYTRALGRRCK